MDRREYMIVILYNDMDVIAPYTTNEPLSHCYVTNGWCLAQNHAYRFINVTFLVYI